MAAMIACAFSPSNIKSENSYPFEDSSVVSKFTEFFIDNIIIITLVQVSPAEIMSNTCTFTLSTIESYGDWSLGKFYMFYIFELKLYIFYSSK